MDTANHVVEVCIDVAKGNAEGFLSFKRVLKKLQVGDKKYNKIWIIVYEIELVAGGRGYKIIGKLML